MATTPTPTPTTANPPPIVEPSAVSRDAAYETAKAQKEADLQAQRVLVEAAKVRDAEAAGKKAQEEIAAKALAEAKTAVAADDKAKAEEKAKFEKASASTAPAPVDDDDEDDAKWAKNAAPKGKK